MPFRASRASAEGDQDRASADDALEPAESSPAKADASCATSSSSSSPDRLNMPRAGRESAMPARPARAPAAAAAAERAGGPARARGAGTTPGRRTREPGHAAATEPARRSTAASSPSERFLALCVALPELGEAEAGTADLDALFTSHLTRLAADRLRGHLDQPGVGHRRDARARRPHPRARPPCRPARRHPGHARASRPPARPPPPRPRDHRGPDGKGEARSNARRRAPEGPRRDPPSAGS